MSCAAYIIVHVIWRKNGNNFPGLKERYLEDCINKEVRIVDTWCPPALNKHNDAMSPNMPPQTSYEIV